jgi:hypothetical protein
VAVHIDRIGNNPETGPMSAIGHDVVHRRESRIQPPGGRRAARAMRRLGHGERYSPILCVATLLIVGLLVKTAPLIQQVHLAHN